jgi:hypothetical protein
MTISKYLFYDKISSALGLGTRDSASVESRKGMWNLFSRFGAHSGERGNKQQQQSRVDEH